MQVAPIAITPLIIVSGNLLGKLAGIVNNLNRGIIDRTRNWAQERAAYQAAKNRAGKSLNQHRQRYLQKVAEAKKSRPRHQQSPRQPR